jgi:multidrug efflux pump subunit AcrA (membrane-fusion protein)
MALVFKPLPTAPAQPANEAVGQAQPAQQAPPAAGPRPQEEAVAALRRLLGAEAEIRAAVDMPALGVVAVEAARAVLGARQVFWIDVGARGALTPRRVSGLVTIDRDAPAVRWLASALTSALEAAPAPAAPEGDASAKPPGAAAQKSPAPQPAAACRRLRLDAAVEDDDEPYPYAYALWAPMTLRGDAAPFAALLALREREWIETDEALAMRVAATTAHAALALRAGPRLGIRRSRRVLPFLGLAALAALAALAIPAPMTAIAPVEIVARAPDVVAAPIEGVIDRILVAPNAQVSPGDVLVQYVDTAQRNQLEIAERELDVAQAKLRQITQSALIDDKARREIAQARADAKLKAAERDYARDQFERSRVKAERAGVAIYADPKEWVGRPVQVGQRILEIADAADVAARVEAPVADAIVVKDGAEVRLFLDADPLRSLSGRVAYASHAAHPVEGQGLSYRLDVALAPGSTTPRIGARGSAQLYGERVPLAFYLLRRPLTWARQRLGL